MAVYLCEICKTQLESVPKCYDEESTGYDKYPLWFHVKCVKVSATSIAMSVTMETMEILFVNKIS